MAPPEEGSRERSGGSQGDRNLAGDSERPNQRKDTEEGNRSGPADCVVGVGVKQEAAEHACNEKSRGGVTANG